jgi:hypothetical protein
MAYIKIVRPNDVWLSAKWTNVVLMKHVFELQKWRSLKNKMCSLLLIDSVVIIIKGFLPCVDIISVKV